MRKYEIVYRSDYLFPQENTYIEVKEFLIAVSQKRKFLLLKLSNNFSQNLHDIKFNVYQLDENGANLKQSEFVFEKFDAKANSTFVPFTKIEVDEACRNIQCKLVFAHFDLLDYNNGEVKELLDHEYVAPVNKVTKDFFINDRKKRLPLAILPIACGLAAILSGLTIYNIQASFNKYETFTLDNYSYSFANSEYSKDSPIIIDSYNGEGTNILIPEKINEHPIIKVNDGAFKNNTKIEKVIIEASAEIGASAFEGCTSLKEIKADNVSSYGESAFYGCSSLDSVEISASCMSIGKLAFASSGVKTFTIDEASNQIDIEEDILKGCSKLEVYTSKRSEEYTNELGLLDGCKSLVNVEMYNCNMPLSYLTGGYSNNLETFKAINVSEISNGFFENDSALKIVEIESLGSAKLGNGAFANTASLETLSLPLEIESVGDYCFEKSNIESIDSSKLTSVGKAAFRNSNLKEIKNSNNITTIKEGAFSNTKLESFTLSNQISEIAAEAFNGCSKLVSFTINDESNLNVIGNNAFSNSAIKEINLVDSIQDIGSDAFNGCINLSSVSLPASIRNIKDSSFKNCSSLTNVDFSKCASLSKISDSTFDSCKSLGSVDLSNSNVSSIGNSAFNNCTSLSEIKFSDYIESFGEYAFANCEALQSFDLPSTINTVSKGLFAYDSKLASITFEGEIKEIGDSAFYSCSSLKFIDVPVTVERIGEKSLYGCNSLSELYLPFIGENYESNKNLSYVFGGMLPSKITKITVYNENQIHDNAFYGSNALKEVNYTLGVTSIGKNAFTNCGSLATLPDISNVETIGENAFSYCSSLASISLPNTLKNISSNILFGCSSLQELEVPFVGSDNTNPKTITYLVGSGFQTSLTSIKVTNATSIASSAFASCSKLTSLTLNEGVTTIGDSAFSDCNSLTILNLPQSVTSLGKSILYNCESLKELTCGSLCSNTLRSLFINIKTNIGEVSTKLTKINLLNETSLATDCFSNCSSIEEVNISGESFKSIKARAFTGCSSLKTITVPDSLETIGENSFYGCNSLTKIDFSSTNLNNVDSYAFSNCGNLTSFILPSNDISYGQFILSSCNKISEISLPSLNNNKIGYFFNNILTNTNGAPSSLKKVTLTNEKELASYALSGLSSLEEVSISGESFTKIKSYAFENCSSLSSISLAESLVDIEDYAFNYCESLSSINLPNSLTTLGSYSFANCNKLTVMDLSKTNVEKISDYAFYSCKLLEKIELSDKTKIIGNNSFAYCSSLHDVDLSSTSITNVNSNAFSYCTLMESFALPTTATNISGSILANCSSIKSLTLATLNSFRLVNLFSGDYYYSSGVPSSLVSVTLTNETSLAENSFYDCSNLVKISVTGTKFSTIGRSSFYGCSSLSDLTLGDSYTKIGNSAFQNCTSLESIDIPSSLTSLGSNVFYGCESLKKIDLSNSSINTIDNYCFYGCSSLESIELPIDVKSIGQYSFYNCESLKDIDFSSSSITSIKENAFGNCSSLTSLKLPDSISSITNGILNGCSSLEDLTIGSLCDYSLCQLFSGYYYYYDSSVLPKTLESVTITNSTSLNNTFQNCENIKKISISGSNCKSIGSNAFYNCSSLEELTIPSSVTTIESYAFYNCSKLTEIEIPSSVTSMSYSAFNKCESLKEIDLKDTGITSLESNMFNGCTALEKVSLPSKLTTIQNNVFDGCSSLEDITIPSTVTSINSNAFNNCSSLTKLEVPKDVTYLGSSFLQGCTSLEKLIVPFVGTTNSSYYSTVGNFFNTSNENVPSSLKEITITSVETINSSNFQSLKSVETITIASDITTIPSNAFSNCYKLKEITLPDSVTTINSYAFSNCYSLESFEITDSMVSIGGEAFYQCSSLLEVFNNSSTISLTLGSSSYGSVAYYALSVSTDGESKLEKFEDDAFKYTYYDSKVYITKYISKEEEATIPTSVTYKEVNYDNLTLLSSTFIANDILKKVTIPKGVASLASSSFKYASSLEEVVFEEDSKVTTINNNLFANCTNLKKITLPNSINYIQYNSFYNCTSLFSIIIPENVTYIDWDAFYGCNKLFEVYNLSSLNVVKGNSDNGSVALNAIKVHTSLSETPLDIFTSGDYEFVGTDDEYYLINYLGESKDVDLPSSVTYKEKTITSYEVYRNAFKDMSLTSLKVSSAVTKIGDYAFFGNYSMSKIDFENATNLESIGSNAFYNIGSLQGVDLSNSSKLESIGSYAFAYCYNIKEIKLPDSLVTISNSAFNNANNATSLEFGVNSKLTTIGHDAFNNCSKLESVVIPSSVTSIGSYAFSNCPELLEVYNLSSLDIKVGETSNGYVAYNALVVHKSLTEEKLARFTYENSNFVAYEDKVILLSVNGTSNYKLPEKVEYNNKTYETYEIGSYIFNNFYYEIGTLTIPKSVISISEYAFANCYYLKEVIFEEGSSITTIKPYTFSSCGNLQRVVLPDSLTKIESNSFNSSNQIISVVLPAKLETIEDNAFDSSNNIFEIVNKSNIKLEKGTTTNGNIAKNAFYISSSEKDHNLSIVTGNYSIKVNDYDGGYYNYYNIYCFLFDEKLYVNYYENYFSGQVKLPEKIKVNDVEYTSYTITGSLYKYSSSEVTSIIIPSSVTVLSTRFTSQYYNLSKIYYGGTKKAWEEANNYKSNKLYFYVDCVHDANQWTYDDKGSISTKIANLTFTKTKESTCEKAGVEEATCPICNEKVERELPLASHTMVSGKCSVCGAEALIIDDKNFTSEATNITYFAYQNGQIESTNHGVHGSTASFTINITQDCTVSFDYFITSESGCDFFTYKEDGINRINQSGDNFANYVNYSKALSAGTVLTFTYSKDGSADWGIDGVYIKNLRFDY